MRGAAIPLTGSIGRERVQLERDMGRLGVLMPQSRCTNVVIPTSDCTLLLSIWEMTCFFANSRYPQVSLYQYETKMLYVSQ